MSILGMDIGDIIAALSLALACITALVGGLYTVISSTKKFELAEEYKKELISWYSQVSFVIEEILASHDEKEKKEALGKHRIIGQKRAADICQRKNYNSYAILIHFMA